MISIISEAFGEILGVVGETRQHRHEVAFRHATPIGATFTWYATIPRNSIMS